MHNQQIPLSTSEKIDFFNTIEAQLKRGVPAYRAKEVAVEQLQHQRRVQAATDSTAELPGYPEYNQLMARSRNQLYAQARELEIRGRSAMTKSQLADAICQFRKRLL